MSGFHVEKHGRPPGELPHSAFDSYHPPSAALIADCVHCGFCLPACPTYQLWGEEMDSPRGRIHLMKMGLEGDVEMDETIVRHFDACLGCMACVTACPSGVQFDKLIEATRAQVERNYARPFPDRSLRRLIFWVFPYPRRLRIAAVLAWLYQRLALRELLQRTRLAALLPAPLRALEGLLPDVALADIRQRVAAQTPALGPARLRVGIVTGCVQSVFFSGVNDATVRVLVAEGCEVSAPRRQGCCGALMLHAGNERSAREVAKALIAEFERPEVDRIAVNAAGCGSALKEYAHLLRDEPAWADRATAFSAKVRDVMELLDELSPQATRHPVPARVAYHDACHLSHAQGVRTQPRRQLWAIPELVVLDVPEAELCCGSAGIYNLVEFEAAEDLGRRKAAHLAGTDPDLIATGNPGCTLQIRRHLPAKGDGIPVVHPIQLVDASIRGINRAEIGRRQRKAYQ